jgi:cytochrome c oxidase subunit 2
MAETHGSQATPHRPPVERRTILRLLAIGVVASAIGIVLGLLIPWFPTAAAKQAHPIDTLYYVLIVCTVPVFVLVTTTVLFAGWRWRMRPGEERLDGPPIHGNTRLEVIWTALPSAMIAALVVYAAIVLGDIGAKQPNELNIGVTGQQFEWTFSYPAYHDAEGQPIVSYVLYLPVNRPVDFSIHAVDVIHTFWVPAFRLQEDAVPGITTGFRATPNRIGTYPIICNQLCGYGHSTMRTTLHIVSAAAFKTWLAQHGYSGAQTASVHTAPAKSVVGNAKVADAGGWTRYALVGGTQTQTKEGTQ